MKKNSLLGMKEPFKTLIAVETGSFELKARLMESESASGKPPLWDRNAAVPLAIWIASPDNNGELIALDGNKIQDMGVYRLPFKVDTHLRIKLLMLMVITAAVFLFIMEWVRVDVVAIAMLEWQRFSAAPSR